MFLLAPQGTSQELLASLTGSTEFNISQIERSATYKEAFRLGMAIGDAVSIIVGIGSIKFGTLVMEFGGKMTAAGIAASNMTLGASLSITAAGLTAIALGIDMTVLGLNIAVAGVGGFGHDLNRYFESLECETKGSGGGLPENTVHAGKPGSKNWRDAVKLIRDGKGKGINVETHSKADAQKLLQDARPKLKEFDTYTAKEYKAGFEIHPAEPNVGNNLPHIKWKDWTNGKSQGANGHIFFKEG